MPYGEAPRMVKVLLWLKWPDHEIALTSWHSERCLTITAVSPDHHAVRCRWNLGDSGRWTMIPVSQGHLDGLLDVNE